MLILMRKVGERIKIGSDTIVEIRKVSGKRVTVGVLAPKNVTILRDELEAHPAPSPLDAGIATEFLGNPDGVSA